MSNAVAIAALAAVASLLCGVPLATAQGRTFTWADIFADDATGSATGAQALAAECSGTVVSVLQADPALSLIAKAIQQTGVIGTLQGPGPMTVFAPTDAAFMSLSESSSSSILNMDLGQLLKYHVADGNVDLSGRPGATSTASFASLTGQPISAQITPGAVVINGDARVVSSTQTCNGQVLVVDKVLIVPGFETSSPLDGSMGGGQVGLGAERGPPCRAGECCDSPPPDFTCAEQVEWGKCKEDWLVTGGYCRLSCGYCFQSDGGSGLPPATAVDVVGESGSSAPNFLSDAFDPMSAYVRSGVLFQQWHEMGGTTVQSMLNDGRILEKPDESEIMEGAQGFEAPGLSGAHRDAGSRISGFFCPPFSGDYRFFLSSDDESALYLADGPADAKARTLKVSGYLRPSEWKTSEVVMLRKGSPKFLEVLHKQGGGSGHVSLGVQLPSGAVMRPIPASMFSFDCSNMAEVAEELRDPPSQLACACTEDGYSGPPDKRVNTGQPGCFRYDFRDDMLGSASSFGQRFGAGIGQYFVNTWGASSDAIGGLSRFWGAAAAQYAGANRSTRANICYVRYPAACPTSFPSRALPGAEWRVCD